MQTPKTSNARTIVLLILIAILAVACARSTRDMTTLPEDSTAPGAKQPSRAVVLFRVVVDSDGQPLPAALATDPRWKWHFLVNAGPTQQLLDSGRAFAAGQLDSTHKDAGWGFVTLPPGSYELAFAAFRTRFTMPGAQRAALGFGQSNAARLVVPADVTSLYVGTFAFTCHKADRWWGYVEHECTRLEIRDESALAREVASASLSRFGPLQQVLASSSTGALPQ